MKETRIQREKYHKVKKSKKSDDKWDRAHRWSGAWKYKKNEIRTTYQESPEGKFKSAEFEAQRLRLDFKITKTQFRELLEQKCHYCGSEGGQVDRKRPFIGFEAINCVPICELCKELKGKMEFNQFIEAICRISAHMDENPDIF
jgi:hypothetical protein